MTGTKASTSPVFDAAPDARPLFKERLLWTLLIGGFFFLVYGSANQISALSAPHPSFYWDWEKSLPFIPELILPYMSSDILFIIAFLLAPNRRAIQKLGLRCALAIVISAIVFLLLPLQFDFVRPETTGWTKPLFDALSLDQPYNQLPSLHISLGYICWRIIHQQSGLFLRFIVGTWFLLIAASTVLVYQHHFIDVLGGGAVVFAVHMIIPDQGNGWLHLRFVSPRHLHMSLRYFILAAVMAVVAFYLGPVWILPFWICISLLLVAGSYCLGLNNFLRKSEAGHDMLSWLLFWPYLVGSWINWRYWRRHITMMSEVSPGVWMGARPGPMDWSEMKTKNITAVIDLVPELASRCPSNIEYHHHPLLDIAIPDPAKLDSISHLIESLRQTGNVYIHCALGMSRSALAISAWLMSSGKTPHAALAAIDAVRPHRVTRPYMEISLDLLQQYRRTDGGSFPLAGKGATSS
jgi:protein-tyrosine phosphatase/membrane-associated phospholipid phosphatase